MRHSKTDTDQWDSDGDGVSNLSESVAGTNPLGDDALRPVQPTLELVADKAFRISWQPSAGAEFYRVFENPDGVSGYDQISGDLTPAQTTFDNRVALYNRVNARYLVQACNASGCVDSGELSINGTLEEAIAYFKSSPDNNLGSSVALSADGNLLAVGSPRADRLAGAVYVYSLNNDAWEEMAYLQASNRGPVFGATETPGHLRLA